MRLQVADGAAGRQRGVGDPGARIGLARQGGAGATVGECGAEYRENDERELCRHDHTQIACALVGDRGHPQPRQNYNERQDSNDLSFVWQPPAGDEVDHEQAGQNRGQCTIGPTPINDHPKAETAPHADDSENAPHDGSRSNQDQRKHKGEAERALRIHVVRLTIWRIAPYDALWSMRPAYRSKRRSTYRR